MRLAAGKHHVRVEIGTAVGVGVRVGMEVGVGEDVGGGGGVRGRGLYTMTPGLTHTLVGDTIFPLCMSAR